MSRICQLTDEAIPAGAAAPFGRPRRWVLAALTALCVGLAACGGGSDGGSGPEVEKGDWGAVINPGGDPVRGGKLRIDGAERPLGTTPLHYLEQPQNAITQVAMQVFDGLVAYEPGSMEPQPALAKDWTISDDGLTYTFNLRDAKFSNGMPVTSADAKFILDKARKSFFAEQFATIERLETPDPKTFVIRLSQPTPALLAYLGTTAGLVVPSKLVKEQGQDAFNKNPIGSGPFLLKEWKRDRSVTLVRNENHWRPELPYLDSVEIITIPDDNTRVLNVESGTADVADLVPFDQITRIDKGGAADVITSPGLDMYAVIMHNGKKPFDELEVRQALNYATPVKSIVDTVFKGHAPRMNTVIPKMKYWTDQAKAYPHDPEKAKELLAQSSVPDGFSTSIDVIGSDHDSGQVAQILKEAWAEIGVDLKIRQMDDAAQSDRFLTGQYELRIARPGTYTSDVAVDDQFAGLMFDSAQTNNLFTHSKTPKEAELFRQATRELDEDKRRDLFAQMHIESMKNALVIPLSYTPNRAAVSKDVHAFNYLVSGWWRLDTVWKG